MAMKNLDPSSIKSHDPLHCTAMKSNIKVLFKKIRGPFKVRIIVLLVMAISITCLFTFYAMGRGLKNGEGERRNGDLELHGFMYDRWRLFKYKPFVAVGTDWGLLSTNGTVCLASQTSLDGLHWLLEVLEAWSGPVSLATFGQAQDLALLLSAIKFLKACVPAVDRQVSFHISCPAAKAPGPPIAGARWRMLEDMLESASAGGKCSAATAGDLLAKLTAEFSKGASSHGDEAAAEEYPQNFLRNLGKSGCQTEHVMLVDVDMIPKRGLYQELEKFLEPNRKRAESCPKCAYVVPVYEIRLDQGRLPETKAELVGLVHRKRARVFHSAIVATNQKASDLKRWEELPKRASSAGAAAVDDANGIDKDEKGGPLTVAYKVNQYSFGYEPIYVARGDTPIFDERFIGYGMTRKTQVYEMYVANYTFNVLDNAFLSHWGFQDLSQRPRWRALQQDRNNAKFDEFAKEVSARYSSDPYGMLKKLARMNLKNTRVAFNKG